MELRKVELTFPYGRRFDGKLVRDECGAVIETVHLEQDRDIVTKFDMQLEDVGPLKSAIWQAIKKATDKIPTG